MTDVAVLVPRRADGGHRDRLWRYVRARWETEHPAYRILEGHHDEGPFNRSAAINAAAELADTFNVAIIADADSFVGPYQIEEAIARTLDTGRMTLAYDRFTYLGRSMSERIMEGFDGDWSPGVEWSLPGTCSSMVVVTSQLWDDVGGFDEGFVGWGGEDIAFSLAAQTFGDGLERVPGHVWHLWHPPAEHAAGWPDVIELYKEAVGDPDAMRALLESRRRVSA